MADPQPNRQPRPPGRRRSLSMTTWARSRPRLAAMGLGLLLVTTGCGESQISPTIPSPTACPAGDCATEPPNQPAAVATASPVHTIAAPTGIPVQATPAQTAPASATPATPAAFRSDAVALGPVIWATAIDPETNAPRDQVSTFSSDTTTLYGVLRVERIEAGTSIRAHWTYNRTRLDSFDREVVAAATGTSSWVEFHLALGQPGAWPTGTYELDIAVDGVPAVRGTVEVRDA